MPKTQSFKEAIGKIADDINYESRNKLLTYFNKQTVFSDYIKQAKASGIFEKSNKSKTMKKIATFPVEVDNFFTKIYGADYYKDPKFFDKVAPEWRVNKWKIK